MQSPSRAWPAVQPGQHPYPSWCYIDDWSINFEVFDHHKELRLQRVEFEVWHIHKKEGFAVHPDGSKIMYVEDTVPLLYTCPDCGALLQYQDILTCVKIHELAKT